MTHSATWVGIGAAAQFIPNVVMGPLGGAWADRFDRRKVLIVTQTGGIFFKNAAIGGNNLVIGGVNCLHSLVHALRVVLGFPGYALQHDLI